MENFTLGAPLRGQFQFHWLKSKVRTKTHFRRIAITQLFGENRVNYYKQFNLKGHNGIDFRVKNIRTTKYDNGKYKAYAPIYAAHDGTVISDASRQSDTKGRYVSIISDPVKINGTLCKVETVYFHLAYCSVSNNDEGTKKWWKVWRKKSGGNKIRRGSIIGYGGNTGKYTTGAHLHFGMRIHWYDGVTKKYVYNSDNGYGGYVDPMPYFDYDGIMRFGDGRKKTFFYKGKIITDEEIKNLNC